MHTELPRPSLGVLNLAGGEEKFKLSRHAAADALSFFVKHYWIVSWDCADDQPYLQHVVPNPCVNLVVEPKKTFIYGPSTRKFSYLIHGKGIVFGVKFKPGGFYPFLNQPVSNLLDRPLEVMSILDLDGPEPEEMILSCATEQDMVGAMDKLLLPKMPPQDEQILYVNQMIDYIANEHDISKVDQVCDRFSIHIRKLQRLFDQYVGISPKWVIRLHRLQNAAEMMDRRLPMDLARLSTELGYHDQSHFIKDFKAVVGCTPDEYRRTLQGI
ncbi:helix-turn-helix domain-containing protein [Paenibacillus sp.]|jgi:AraC-like DNA-binding protein|uniref:AraC family transcriptional regulator n=1 Tax=Paenibacillus sp. TaxID=58172 RepID=UPI0028274627|nr:helix-turn-helix domain-containing protein [Paenibacillus sp.]MDR0270450.1 helix-turn-helix domain-containing protein [Paenibacillus sp.]